MYEYETPRPHPSRPARSGHVLVLPPIRLEVGLVVCSRCLRVERGSRWVEAENVIRVLRSFELPEAVKLRPGLCDRCRQRIESMRHDALILDELAA